MDDRLPTFQQWLKEHGLKATSQRDDIARVFFASGRHISVEELYHEVRAVNSHVGYATVYRTLRLLKECGMAVERHFHDGEARYEHGEKKQEHHEHFLCERCSRIVEFSSPESEEIYAAVATRLGFVITRHRLELYGICATCREGPTLTRSRRGRTRRGRSAP